MLPTKSDSLLTTSELDALLLICCERERQCYERGDHWGEQYWGERYEAVQAELCERPEWMDAQSYTSIRLCGGL
jgi:hypothetical protein